MTMLTMEQLRALRGIAHSKTEIRAEPQNIDQNSSAEISEKNVPFSPTQKSIQPINIACKNYLDEDGHFAYIDAYTHEVSHVNLNTGKVYTQEEVNQLSLSKSTLSLSDEAQKLSWEQVVSDETLYDQFGSPVFTYAEIQDALHKLRETSAAVQDSGLKVDSSGKDPWGLPL